MTDFVFIDSGVGGIPYMTNLIKREPAASCVYVADTANFPYGEKSHSEVVSCVLELVKKIQARFSPAVIVVACNTMSVNALDELRASFPSVSFVGTVPAIKLAASVSKKRRIGLIATKATCENPYNLELKEKIAADCTIINRADPELISYIEHNVFTASREECLAAVKPAVDFFRSQDCDVIILGCTHFLNITDIFREACGPDLQVVDSVDGVVRHSLEVRWPEGELPESSESQSSAQPSLFVTGFADNDEKAQFDALCAKFGLEFAGVI